MLNKWTLLKIDTFNIFLNKLYKKHGDRFMTDLVYYQVNEKSHGERF